MRTIATDSVDKYVQKMCTDTSLTPAERAQQAATAMHVHVMQEAGLHLGTRLPVDPDLVEHHEVFLDAKGDRLIDDIYEQSAAAWEALEEAYPEYAGEAEPPVQPDQIQLVLNQKPIFGQPVVISQSEYDEQQEQAKVDRFMKGESE